MSRAEIRVYGGYVRSRGKNEERQQKTVRPKPSPTTGGGVQGKQTTALYSNFTVTESSNREELGLGKKELSRPPKQEVYLRDQSCIKIGLHYTFFSS